MTKKIVALLLVIATLCLPFCGLADDIPKTLDGVAEWFLSGVIDWIPMDVEISEAMNDWIVLSYLSEYNCVSFAYKGQTYSYFGMNAKTTLVLCLGMLIACEGATYMKNWAFTADDKTYTETQVKMLVIQLTLEDAYK